MRHRGQHFNEPMKAKTRCVRSRGEEDLPTISDERVVPEDRHLGERRRAQRELGLRVIHIVLVETQGEVSKSACTRAVLNARRRREREHTETPAFELQETRRL